MNIIEYESYKEQTSFFDDEFPYNTYPCSIPLDFVEVPPHWHQETEFIYIKKGRGIISLDLKEYEVTAGDIVFVVPGRLHSISQLGNESMEYENIIFDSSMILSGKADQSFSKFIGPILEQKIDVPSMFTEGEKTYQLVRNCLDNNDEICMTFPEGYQLGIKSSLYLLFFNLVKNYETRAASHEDDKNMEKLKSVIKHVELHYDEQMTIEEMAKLCGFSESHFMRFFKDTMGMSFVNFLNDYRMTIAARMLLQSEDTILTISQQVGFENLSHFNRCFKKKYEITPSQYRRKY